MLDGLTALAVLNAADSGVSADNTEAVGALADFPNSHCSMHRLRAARHSLMRPGRGCQLARELEALDAAVLAFEQFAGSRVSRRISDFVLGGVASGKMRVALLNTAPWRALHRRLVEDSTSPLTLEVG